MSKFINILKVAFATIGSRILGLVRDALSMAYMSIGAVSSAYTFAFTLPNLFRRLLGEGALSSAIVPIFSGALKNKGLPDAFDFLNKATSRAIVGMIIIVTIGMLLSLLSMLYFDTEQTRYFLGAKYSLILFPYLLLICVAAIFSAVLNVLDSFGIPSITPIILNVCIIAGLFCGVYIFGKSDIENI
ncbi:MAG: murein biosynthesis integral membrane protein MurJ, partial [Opitutales bacterium]|nr:murein biosynthesis integral membrane protein MurJ [Opitutales bacterium]